jgi:hypothetical protein
MGLKFREDMSEFEVSMGAPTRNPSKAFLSVTLLVNGYKVYSVGNIVNLY